MAIRTDSPQVAALLKETENIFGRPVRTPSDFLQLADKIESKTREHISDSTVKRLWKPSLSYKTVSDRSLNVIAQYAGYPHFEAFCARLVELGIIESELVSEKGSVKAADLIPGDKVRISWQPDRECLLKYLGDRQFLAIEAKNSKIQPGDTFRCSSFIRGRALYVDDFEHDGTVFDSYAMGIGHGLTSVSIE